MKCILRTLCFVVLAFCTYLAEVDAQQSMPITTDSRIKTFVYNPNEVFPIILHFGYQTSIEFGKDEIIQTYSVGNSYAWKFSIVGRTLFMKPLEENVMTNMTVITNKRRYIFDLQSFSLSSSGADELCYVIRFFYPDNEEDSIKPEPIEENDENGEIPPTITAYNFHYSITGCTKSWITPVSVFDNGVNTFFEYKSLKALPKIYSVNKGRQVLLDPRQMGKFLVVNTIADEFLLVYNGDKIKIKSRTSN